MIMVVRRVVDHPVVERAGRGGHHFHQWWDEEAPEVLKRLLRERKGTLM